MVNLCLVKPWKTIQYVFGRATYLKHGNSYLQTTENVARSLSDTSKLGLVVFVPFMLLAT